MCNNNDRVFICLLILCITMLYNIEELIWDEWNIGHIKKHEVSVIEVEETCYQPISSFKSYQNRLIVLGKTKSNRLITLVLMKNERIILKFKNIKEESDFWDKNDVVDFLPKMKKIRVKYSPKILKEENIVIRVQPKMKKRLEIIAENEGLTLSTMLRMWFVERLNKTS